MCLKIPYLLYNNSLDSIHINALLRNEEVTLKLLNILQNDKKLSVVQKIGRNTCMKLLNYKDAVKTIDVNDYG